MPLLTETGEALFGPRWQSELARALELNLRTVQRWAVGQGEPPAGVYAELVLIARERRQALRGLLPELAKAAGQ